MQSIELAATVLNQAQDGCNGDWEKIMIICDPWILAIGNAPSLSFNSLSPMLFAHFYYQPVSLHSPQRHPQIPNGQGLLLWFQAQSLLALFLLLFLPYVFIAGSPDLRDEKGPKVSWRITVVLVSAHTSLPSKN